MSRAKALGTRREHAVKRLLEADGWLVMRAPASLGVADLIALKDGERPRLLEVKANKGSAFMNFRPDTRARLTAAAKRAGADAELAHWPVGGKCRFILSNEWPGA